MTRLNLKIGGYGPEKSTHGRGLAAIRDGIQQGTNGDVRVEVIWNIMESGRPNVDLFEMVEAGEMFLCYFSTSYQAKRVPELNVIETPYLFRDLRHAHESLDGDLGDRLKTATRVKTGFEILGFWDNGFRHMTNRHHPVCHPNDLAGMTVRIQPNTIHEALIRAWGAVPVAVDLKPGIELIAGLAVDAQENPLANTVAYGVDKVHRYVTMTGHLYGSRGLFANRESYQTLPRDVREVVDQSVRTAVLKQREAGEDFEGELRLRLEADGLEFVDLDDESLAGFIEVAAPAVDLAREALPNDLFTMAAV